MSPVMSPNRRILEWVQAAEDNHFTIIDVDSDSITISDGEVEIRLSGTGVMATSGSLMDTSRRLTRYIKSLRVLPTYEDIEVRP